MDIKETIKNSVAVNNLLPVSDKELIVTLEFAGLGYFERNWQTGKCYWSNEFYKLLGIKPINLDSTPEDFLKFVHKDDLKRVDEYIKTSLQHKSDWNIEFRIVQPEGNEVDIQLIGNSYFDNKGKPIKTIGTFQNITERKRLLSEVQEKIEELSFLNRIFVSAQKTESLDEICEIIAKEIHAFYPDSYVTVSLYDNELGGVRIRAIEGVDKKYQQVAKLLGKDPKKMVFDAKKLDKSYEHYTTGSPVKVEGGLAELMTGQLPAFICRNAEKLMSVTSVYVAGFKDSEMAKGGINIFMRNNKQLLNPKPIETALGYVSELLKRKLSENELRKNEILLR